ncbi:MAG: MFS transporter [Caldilineaceae bacterium]|nr:MFS transporter [Caldilineaceae bacterium]
MQPLELNRARLLDGMFAPLRNLDYRRLLLSNGLWWATIFMEGTVLGWLVLDLTDSPWMVAIVGFCRSVPFPIMGFLNGPLIDRFGRRSIMLAAQTTNLLTYVAISALLWSGHLALWHLMFSAMILGICWALDWPARRALMPDLVGKERTVDAMLLENMAQNVARIGGPALAGWLIAAYGPRGCFTVMAILSLFTLAMLRTLSQQPIPRVNMRPQLSPWTIIGETLRYARHSQAILGVLLITAVMNIFIFPYMTLLSVFARDVLQQGPVGLGILGTGSGIGAFLGLYLINRLRQRISPGWIFIIGTCFMCLMLTAFALSTIFTLSWSLLFLMGIGQACFGSMQSSIIILSSSDEMRSRAMGTLVLAISADPLGKLQTGFLADQVGVQNAVAAQATMGLLVIGTIALFLPGLRSQTTAESIPVAADD